MPLPIPHILNHALASCDAETRECLRLFEGLVARLEPALKRRIQFNGEISLEFPQLVASYLLSSLQRVRITAWGVITALNAPNELLFVTSVRSILESTANTAYLLSHVQKTYAGDLSRKEMTYLSFRMKFATRKPDDMELNDAEVERVTSINVLTAIKSLDRYAMTELGFANKNAMTTWYERLCEFAHPNCLGNTVGSQLDFPAGVEIFEVDPGVRPEILPLFSNYSFGALYGFCLAYNACWRMLIDAREVLPAWEPLGDPRIRLD